MVESHAPREFRTSSGFLHRDRHGAFPGCNLRRRHGIEVQGDVELKFHADLRSTVAERRALYEETLAVDRDPVAAARL